MRFLSGKVLKIVGCFLYLRSFYFVGDKAQLLTLSHIAEL